MAQLKIRTADELVRRVREAAATRGTSMNAFVEQILDTATNPDLVENDSERIRERLRAAGILQQDNRVAPAPPSEQRLDDACAAAGHGTPLSELVTADR
jgi:hypothetical protein